MRKSACSVLLVFFLLITLAHAEWRPGEMKVRLRALSPRQIQEIFQQGFLVDEVRNQDLLLLVIPQELEKLRNMGYQPEIVIPDMAAYSRSLLGSPEMSGYHDYYSTRALVDSLLNAFPNLITKVTYGFSLGGKELYAVKISDQAAIDEPEPEVAFDGCHHGDEIMSSECIVLLMRDLCVQYGSDPQITELVNTREIWIFPFINPDGRQVLSRYNNAGVDLNRDWGYMWDGWGGSTAAYSQPETQAALRWYLDNQFVIAQTGHGGTELISHPWSYRPDPSPDHTFINYLAGGYAAHSGYPSLPYGPGYNGLYPINGSAKDSYYGIRGSVSWTMEFSNNKTPPASQIPLYYGYNKNAMLYLIEMSGQGISGTVLDAVTGQPVPALIWVSSGSQEYWPVYADPQVGDFHKFVLPGTYQVRVTANGYQPTTINNVTVVDTGATQLQVFLQPALGVFGYQVIASQIPGNNFQDEGMIPWAFGAPDGRSYSLGRNGWIVLDMGESMQDYPGTDLTVHEGDATPEGYSVLVSNNYLGPWTLLGSGMGTQEFDLASAGVSAFRYVKIQDDGDGPSQGADVGFDLDAVEGRSVPPAGPFVMPVQFVVVDSTSNANGILEAGEMANLDFLLFNLGADPADQLSLSVTSLDSQLAVLQDSVFVGNLTSGDSAWARGVLISVDPATPHLAQIPVQVQIRAAGGYLWNIQQMLTVHQGSRISVTPRPVVFDPTFMNSIASQPVTVQNQGRDTLKVSQISSATPYFWAEPTTFALAPGKSRSLEVFFQPTDTLFYRDTLVFQTNDPTQLSYGLPVSGKGALAPDIQAGSDSIAITLLPTDSADVTFTILNAGAGSLSFGARITSYLPGEKINSASIVEGGGDAFGHIWVDSDEPGGPAYNWIEIGDGSGTEIPFASSNAISDLLPLGFSFALYDQPYQQLRVCTNGWFSFTTFSVSYNNVPLPNSLAPKAMVAPLWDNLQLQSGSRVLYRQDPDRFIIQWENVYTTSGAGPYTFQAILYQDGDILLQYKSIQQQDSSYTIGMQNELGNDGFTVAYNQPYLHDELAILITRRNWVSIFPQSGQIDPFSSANLTLHFQTEDFPEGDFWAALEITSNDPDEPVLLIPIHMKVSSVVSVAEDAPRLPTRIVLEQNYPNPFNPTTTIRFSLPERTEVRLVVYNALGQQIRLLMNEQLEPGSYQVVWDATTDQGLRVPSGLYFYELRAAGRSLIRKMILLH